MAFAVITFAFNGYYINRIFRNEFYAKYKAAEISKEFQKFLNCLPEGISIMNNSSNQFKFINKRLKSIFDVRSFYKTSETIENIENLQHQIDTEFNEAIKKISAKPLSSKESQKFMDQIMNNFTVKNVKKEGNINYEFEQIEEDESTLDQFLATERMK
mmetsp:Transcript_9473/g.10710  ORF Transcript_9473/g.10710 Transcript_9473/m.10710 type:complete len:158 (+) Transcript_9473:144-617(+)